jgi:hypothetical protein
MTDAVETIQVGQTVNVRDNPTFGIVLTVRPDGDHEVVAVGPEEVVLSESATGCRKRFPRYLIALEPQPPQRPPQADAARPTPEPVPQPTPIPA